MPTSDDLRAQLAEAEAREAAEQAEQDRANAVPDENGNTANDREHRSITDNLVARVDYLYEALKDQIQYHGQRNGPASPAAPVTGLENEV
jgi:hypothetical protein